MKVEGQKIKGTPNSAPSLPPWIIRTPEPRKAIVEWPQEQTVSLCQLGAKTKKKKTRAWIAQDLQGRGRYQVNANFLELPRLSLPFFQVRNRQVDWPSGLLAAKFANRRGRWPEGFVGDGEMIWLQSPPQPSGEKENTSGANTDKSFLEILT